MYLQFYYLYKSSHFFHIICYKKCCKNTPCKRISRSNGIKLEMGEMTHELDEDEPETIERLENIELNIFFPIF